MKNKKIVFIFVLICITIFIIFYYIFFILVNNMSRNKEENVENILNRLNNYEANINVIVKSNKTENNYNIQQVVDENSSRLIVNSPENVAGMKIELEGNILKFTNGKNNMEKVYNDYKDIMNNSLFLNSFIEDYKNNSSKIYENEDEIIIQINVNNNTYVNFKELHLDKEKKVPKELIVGDNTKKDNICIIYNDIKIK